MSILRNTLHIDIETFSSVDLTKSGLYKYVQSSDFQILLLAYAYNDEPVKVIDLTANPNCAEMTSIGFALNDPMIIKHAHNAVFEWYCLSKFWPTQLNQWRCSMLHAQYCGYPAALAKVSEAIGMPQDKKKMGVGGSLIRTFCVPTKPSKSNGQRTRTLPHHEPEKWKIFKDYCARDVDAEREVDRILASWPVPEDIQRQWVMDNEIMARGVLIDRDLMAGAIAIDDDMEAALIKEAKELTGLDNPKSRNQMLKWLTQESEDEIPDLRKDTVAALLNTTDDAVIHRMLEIRQMITKTSTKKYPAMANTVCDDGRVRGLLQFYGAGRTGRDAGRLVQVHNLPRSTVTATDYARRWVKAKASDKIRLMYGNLSETLSSLIRTTFIPSLGHSIVVADFSAIEARITAWLAQEQWRLDVFAGHGKIYEASAAAMFDVPIEKIKKGNPEYALRQRGKVAELALGYGGSVGALINMGALDMGIPEEDLPDIVERWRGANSRITRLWKSMETAALDAVKSMHPQYVPIHFVDNIIFAREYDLVTQQDFLTVALPSGRKLFYVKPFLAPNRWGWDSVHYHGTTLKGWVVLDTWGGKLTENVVQAIARDCLFTALEKLHGAGYKILFHVHDEIVVECPTADADQCLKNMCAVMSESIPWAPGLQLTADGFISEYYKKD